MDLKFILWILVCLTGLWIIYKILYIIFVGRWISVATRLPEYDVRVLWLREDGLMFIDEIDHDNSWKHFKSFYETSPFDKGEIKITHWRYLPKLPRK